MGESRLAYPLEALQDRPGSGALDAQLDYWRAHLHGLVQLHLPAGKPRPSQMSSQMSFSRGAERTTISGELLDALKTTARTENASLFMLFATAFNVLLMRHSGQDDVTIGVSAAGQNSTELEGVIGNFIDTVVLRTDLSNNPTFIQLLGRVRQTVLDAHAHRDIPFDRLMTELSPVGTLDHNPLFDVTLNYTEGVSTEFDLSGSIVQPIQEPVVSAQFAMTLCIDVGAQGADVRFLYQRNLFSQEYIAALLDQYVELLEQIAAGPERVIQDYSLVTAAARAYLPDPTAAIVAPPQQLVTEHILHWVQTAPEQVAVSRAHLQWSYGALGAYAVSLATTLRAKGVQRGDVVAIHGERGFELIGAMVAVLLSGGVFLTIDPLLPSERRRLMLREARAKVLCLVGHPVVDDSLADLELTLVSIDAVDVNAPVNAAVNASMNALSGTPVSTSPVYAEAVRQLPTLHENDPAYIFFTSGSSGTPKAVLGCHKGLAHFVHWQQKTFDVAPGDRVSQLIGLSFNPLLRDVFLPLVSGATICVPEERDLVATLRWLQREQITVVHTTPTVLQSWLLEHQQEIALPSLRWLFISGEPLTDVQVSQWRAQCATPAHVVNFYGQTETTMVKCFYPIPPDLAPGRQPIGTSLPGAQALVLGYNGRLCGIGETGEIVVRTPFRTLGYLNLPEENQRRFRKNPYRDDDADLLYFTGDLGRYRPDGVLDIVGRSDDQIKIRGVRVEPGEVSATLARHEAVHRCLVIARPDDRDEHELVAYVVRRPGMSLDSQQLRAYLSAHLADAFVPGLYVFLDALPLLPNGKVDRKALSAPTRDTDDTNSVQPRGPIEQTLWEIWHEVLKRPCLSVHDNFFAMGGHSLLATQVVSRVRDTLQVELPLRALFETSTIAGLAHRIQEVRAGQKSSFQEPQIPALPRDPGASTVFPTSFSQRRMWLVQQYEPDGAAYNMPFALRLTGPLDREVLGRAINVLVSRHEAFRTTFAVVNGEPVQVVAPTAAPVSLAETDLGHLPEPERIPAAERLLRDEALRPFDLEHGPLHRLFLIQLGDADHVFLWLIHHSISDLWSTRAAFRELAVIYRALVRGEPFSLPPLPIQYADFAVWQRRYLGGDAIDGQLAYWRDKLRGVDVLALPTDKPRSEQHSSRGERMYAPLPDATLAALKRMSARAGVTPFMTLLACFKLLLARYSGKDDITVGSPIANRTRVVSENLVGTLVNTLVMRTDLGGDPTFGELLSRVRDTALDAYARQDVPFERLVEEVGTGRDARHAPLVQVLFNGVTTPVGRLSLDGLTLDLFNFDTGSAQFELSMSIDTETFRYINLSYATDLFERATVERMLAHYLGLLEQVIADPDKPVWAYRLVTDRELHQIVHDWNPTATSYPSSQRTDALIAAQAQRTPDAIAVAMGPSALTYAELERRANQLAHYLRRCGVGPDTLVGVSLERSPELIVALLGVMKSGAAYVPLDPSFPLQRLELMAHDAAVSIVLTHSQLLPVLPATLQGRSTCLDRSADEIAAEPVDTVGRLGTPDQLAYVLYTSGSTGTPKGVEISHRALTNLLWSMHVAGPSSPGCTEHDTLLSVTTSSFDISGLEFYLPLIAGGRVALASHEEASDGHLLMQRITQCRPTIMQATPATWRMLIDAGWKGSEHSRGNLRILCGGETLSRDLAVALLDRCAALWNMYGPTETTIWSTAERIEKDAGGDVQEISIGSPIANTEVYILDKMLQPVPAGVPGELFIGGHGVARGYRNRPDLTAERFLVHPFSRALGGAMYRTGDLARWLPDGRIVHLGRLDSQVKIRGFRIELGEIENVLARHPAVARIVVAAKDDRDGMQQLVAYVIAREEMGHAERPSTAELRTFVGATLPSYMVPSHFIFLDAFPLTANNKVDVKALPKPDSASTFPSAQYTGPSGRLQVQLTALWRRVLGSDTAGIHDNFFDMGGHSLQAVQLLSYIKNVTGRQLPLATLFQAPTVAQMAQLLTQSGWEPSWRSLVAIQPSGSALPIFAVPGVGGNVLTFAKLSKLLGSDQPFYGLQAKGLDGNEEPFTSIPAAAAHYIDAMRSVQPRGPYVVAGTCTGGVAAYEMAQQLYAQGEQVTLIILESWPPSELRSRQWLTTGIPWALRTLWFIGAKLASYAHTLAKIPLREWPDFLRSKVSMVGTVWDQGITEALTDEDFQVEQVARATFQAVASYEIREYPGSLLNVIAANRLIAEGGVDTREVWNTLAQGPTCLEFIPAEDSGRLFVSPNVDVLARLITDYVASLRPTP